MFYILVIIITYNIIISAIETKEILEDSARHKSDKYQNTLKYNIIRNKAKKETICADIRQGDVIILQEK